MNEEYLANKLSCELVELDRDNEYLIDKDILRKFNENCERIILITGTNGKTTTNNMLNHILKSQYKTINNINGSDTIESLIAPLLLDINEKYDFGLFEVDENSIINMTKYITPDYLIITNFFRDQLDTFGEVEKAIQLVHDSIKPQTTLILNADDPSTHYFDDLNNKKIYFHQNNISSLKGDTLVAEFLFCPICGNKLDYSYLNYGNIGKYKCSNCGTCNPEAKYNITNAQLTEKGYSFEINNQFQNDMDVIGNYNLYNALAAIATSVEIGIDYDNIIKRVDSYKYKQGRTEFIKLNDKRISLAMTKNPIAVSEQLNSLQKIKTKKSVIFILNDYTADSQDVSWLWDIDFGPLNSMNVDKFYSLGSRRNDLAIRLKYSDFDFENVIIADDSEIKPLLEKVMDESYDVFIMGTPSGISKAKKIIKGDLLKWN